MTSPPAPQSRPVIRSPQAKLDQLVNQTFQGQGTLNEIPRYVNRDVLTNVDQPTFAFYILAPYFTLSSLMGISSFIRFSIGNFFRERTFQPCKSVNTQNASCYSGTWKEKIKQSCTRRKEILTVIYSTSTINCSKKEFSSNGSVFNRSVIRRDTEKKSQSQDEFPACEEEKKQSPRFLGREQTHVTESSGRRDEQTGGGREGDQ